MKNAGELFGMILMMIILNIYFEGGSAIVGLEVSFDGKGSHFSNVSFLPYFISKTLYLFMCNISQKSQEQY